MTKASLSRPFNVTATVALMAITGVMIIVVSITTSSTVIESEINSYEVDPELFSLGPLSLFFIAAEPTGFMVAVATTAAGVWSSPCSRPLRSLRFAPTKPGRTSPLPQRARLVR